MPTIEQSQINKENMLSEILGGISSGIGLGAAAYANAAQNVTSAQLQANIITDKEEPYYTVAPWAEQQSKSVNYSNSNALGIMSPWEEAEYDKAWGLYPEKDKLTQKAFYQNLQQAQAQQAWELQQLQANPPYLQSDEVKYQFKYGISVPGAIIPPPAAPTIAPKAKPRVLKHAVGRKFR